MVLLRDRGAVPSSSCRFLYPHFYTMPGTSAYETVVSSPRFRAEAMTVFNMLKTCDAAW
jgi:hypothetical protein